MVLAPSGSTPISGQLSEVKGNHLSFGLIYLQCPRIYRMVERFPDDKICEGEHLVHLLEIERGIFAEPPLGISCISLETVTLSGEDARSRIRVRFQDAGDSAGLYTGTTEDVQITKLIPEDCFMLTNPDPKFMMHGAPVNHGSPLAVMFRTKDRCVNLFIFYLY